MKWVRLLVLLWFACLAPSAKGAVPETVTGLLVKGNQRVESDLILQKVKSRVGEPLDAAKVREDVRAVYGLGFFRDVQVQVDEQGVVAFVVVERPSLRDWKIEGSKEVDKEELEKAVTLKKREILDDSRVEEGARAVRDIFRDKGYYLAEVRTETIPVVDGKNQVDVVYRVSEGAKVKVKDLHLLGVRAEGDKGVRKFLATGEAGPWSWLTSSGTFKEADLDRDREVIRSYYLNKGYVEVKVLDPLVALTSDRKWLKIAIPVEEGESYRIGKIGFSGDLEFSEERLRDSAKLVEGETFRSDDFRKAVQALSDLYADLGYAFADVDPVTDLDRTNRRVSITFKIQKGDLVRIGRFEVRGNTKTRDRIVRREFRLAEGDLYNATAIRKSRQKIENLGFFQKVNLTTNRRPGTNAVDVDVEVEEKPTGSFSVGAGYSSVDKIIGMASVSQRNFLGLGYQLSASANFGSSRETYSLTFNNPRVFDTQIYAGIDLYKSIRNYTDYDKNAVGGALKLGTALTDEWRTRTVYRWEDAVVRNVSDTASSTVKDEEGKIITSAIAQILTYDSRDNPWEPHGGVLAEGSVELAGTILGGDASYLKYDAEASKYIPLWWRHVLTLHTQAGFIQALQGKEIPLFERYALGGINSVRGFSYRSIGPKDKVGDVIGGNKDFLFNVEYLFPLIEEAKVRGLLFLDAGNVWDTNEPYFSSKLRTGAGCGIRWFSPMGPLRLEWGYNLQPKEDERRSRWEFSIGGFF